MPPALIAEYGHRVQAAPVGLAGQPSLILSNTPLEIEVRAQGGALTRLARPSEMPMVRAVRARTLFMGSFARSDLSVWSMFLTLNREHFS